MAQVLSLSFNLGGELKPSLSNAFKQASSLMSELQDKNSALNKNLSQVNNYSKLEAGLKADKNALAELSAQSVKVKSDLQAASVQVSSLKSQVKTANSEFISSQASLALSREKYAANARKNARGLCKLHSFSRRHVHDSGHHVYNLLRLKACAG